MPDDKFIFMSLKDNDSKNIAEILKSDTAKKILDFLSETREASEKDIADNLNMPINTVEYNLKKLLKTGFIKPSKNFFWSVKGKKIPMYKVAKKHIIISPDKKPSLSTLKTLLPILFIATIALILIVLSTIPEQPTIQDQAQLKQFNSLSDLKNFLEESSEFSNEDYVIKSLGRGVGQGVAEATVSTASASTQTSEPASDYSTTNIQVEGVDEADIVKNDGKYIYLASNNKIYIINAYPAENMEILSEVELSKPTNNIFINNNKLIVFSHNNIYIYNTEDKQNPELEKEIETDGNYLNSRMIGDYVYIISTKYVDTRNPEPPIYIADGIKEKVRATEIYYFDYPDTSYVFTSIIAINVKDNDLNKEVYLTGSSTNIYVSQDNVYLTYQKRFDYEAYAENFAKEVASPLLPSESDEQVKKILDSNKKNTEKLNEIKKIIFDYSNSLTGQKKSDFDKQLLELTQDFETEIKKQMEKTVVHKININKEKITYQGNGEVPGKVLNQFSMDEYQGNFRIATTTGNWGYDSLNHIYILDENLEIIGSIENLAEGERIFSARFMGNRAYLVTFEAIDPLFVIDLSNPEKPEVLGYLKIPGYSDYLHPYDENHVIGIGKDVDPSIDADKIHSDYAVYYTAILGVKVSLFDVSDVANPIEKSKFIIGDRGTESPVLQDHRAFLFDKEKELLVLPVSVVERENHDSKSSEISRWQGAYVFNINLKGITLRGKITHLQDNELNQRWNNQVRRSLYMDNTLYTMSNSIVQANNLNTLEKINYIDLGFEEPIYYVEEEVVQ